MFFKRNFVVIIIALLCRVADANCEPCAPVCDENAGCCFSEYLTEKSVFESKLFNNNLVGKKSKSKISLYGWMLTGITVNNYGETNEYEGGTNAYGYNRRPNRPGITDQSGNTYVLMLEQPSDWKLNHLWLGAKKELDDRFGVGFQVDYTYGTDSRYARNWGDETLDWNWGTGDYFSSLNQLFVTIGTKDLYLRIGKFAGSFAYEGLAAPREFFYSHAHIAYGRPFTTQGATVEWKPNKKWAFSAGWTAGVFTSFENPYHDSAFLGKATYLFTKDISLSYRIFYNDKGRRPEVNGGALDCMNTLIFTWKINEKWFYMGEVAYTDNNYYAIDGDKTIGDAWGINNHLIYTINEKLGVGLRGEFHHSRNSFYDQKIVTGGEGGDLWALTLAARYKINPKLTFRPELRYDYADYKNGYRPFGGNESKNGQLCGGVSFVAEF